MQQAFGQQRRSEPRGEVAEPRNVTLLGWDGEKLTLVFSSHDECRDLQSAMTNKTFCSLLKTLVAFAITGIFSAASLAGEFTVQKGKRYRATLSLNSVERLADNALIASKFRAIGFTKVSVSGVGAVRHVEGVWLRKDASTNLPRQIIAVAGL